MEPKVLVGCPVSDYHEYSTQEYVKAVKNLDYGNYDVLVGDNSKGDDFSKKLEKYGIKFIRVEYIDSPKERIVESRNELRKIVLEKGYDYFLSLEQDVIPPLDIIKKLISHGKDVVTGIYFNYYPGLKEPLPLAFIETGIKNYGLRSIRVDELNSNKLVRIQGCGLGCLLISRKVLERIKFRLDSKRDIFDDMTFCQDVRDNKFELYVDTSIKCKHLLKKRPWSWEKLDPPKEIPRFKQG